jgi:D-alanyl-D-alanine dipeptidase
MKSCNTLIDISQASHEKGAPMLVDSVYATTRNFTRRIVRGYDSPALFTHPTILEKLIAINSYLQKKDTLQIIIKDAYRPIQASQDMNEWAIEQ